MVSLECQVVGSWAWAVIFLLYAGLRERVHMWGLVGKKHCARVTGCAVNTSLGISNHKCALLLAASL